jgi:hypothetical protein
MDGIRGTGAILIVATRVPMTRLAAKATALR